MESPAGPACLADRFVSNAALGFGTTSGGVGLPSTDGGVSGALLAPLGSRWALVGDGGVGCRTCDRVGGSKLKRPWLPVSLLSPVAVLWGSSDGQGRASMTAAITVPGSALTSCSISFRSWWWWLTPWLLMPSGSDSLCDAAGAGAVCSKVVVHGRRALAQRSQASPVASSRWHRSLKLRQRSQAKRREGRKFRLLAPGKGFMAVSDCNRPLERRTCT